MTIVFSLDANHRGVGNWLSLAVGSARRVLPRDTRIVVLTGRNNGGFHTPGCEYMDVTDLYGKTLAVVEKSGYRFHGIPMQLGGLGRLLIPLMGEFAGQTVAYCDADVEFFDPRFAECVGLLDGHEAGMVAEADECFGMKKLKAHADLLKDVAAANPDIPIRPDVGPDYFNSGMIVMGVDAIRRNHPDFAADVAKGTALFSTSGFSIPDQDFLNQYLDVARLPSSFNSGGLMKDQDGKTPYMVHYLGSAKLKAYPYPPVLQRDRILGLSGPVRNGAAR